MIFTDPMVQPPPSTIPRWSLAGLALLHAAVFAAAASVLPWGAPTPFAALATLLALFFALTAALALVGSPRRAVAWRATAFASLLFLGYHTWLLLDSATYIAVLYGSLGEGVAAGLAAVWANLVLFTLPFAAWGIAVTGKLANPRIVGGTSAGIALLVGAGLWRTAAAATPEPHPSPLSDPAQLPAALAEIVADLPPPLPDSATASLMTRDPAHCDAPPSPELATLVVTYLRRSAPPDPQPHRVATRCVQATPTELLPALRAALRDAATRAPLKLDLITATAPLSSAHSAPDAFAVRPALDGICHRGRCFMPWQLVALDHFSANAPLAFIDDFRFGVDTHRLARAFGRQPDPEERIPLDGLTRVTTRPFMVDQDGHLREIPRMRDPERPFNQRTVQEAIDLAERYIVAAQAPDGRFRYLQNPFTGRVSWQGFAVPRQAGTTLALCEVASDTPPVRKAVSRSLKMLASLERRAQDFSALAQQFGDTPPRFAPLGNTALSLIAFLSCRDAVDRQHDQLIARLGRFLLALQRPDGGFHPGYSLQKDEIVLGPDPLYAGGQAVFALTLLEKLAAAEPDGPFPPLDQLRAAVDNAMTYTATRYWAHGLYDFFFLEENWHCLAARASLEHHPHPGYERFCLDYVAFKSRVVYDQDSRVDPAYLGAYGLGNVIPPPNTPAAGFGEALAAAMAIREARGLPQGDDPARMASVLAFLVRQQWRREDCFACAPGVEVAGAFSESVSAPEIRIDFVQHSMAALGHGRRFVELQP